jgi:hypothetical protein
MPLSNRELRLSAKLINLLTTPRALTRAEKKAAGLKYCASAGFGFRWHRGRRVPDQRELEVMEAIVRWRNEGFSWYAIAAHLLQHRVRTKDGKEWSASRVRRAYLAYIGGDIRSTSSVNRRAT